MATVTKTVKSPWSWSGFKSVFPQKAADDIKEKVLQAPQQLAGHEMEMSEFVPGKHISRSSSGRDSECSSNETTN